MINIGVDLLNLDRFYQILSTDKTVFIERNYTEAEITQAGMSTNPKRYFATRFSAKEAIFKCFKISGDRLSDLKEIEILNDENGIPQVKLHGKMKEVAVDKFIHHCEISISHDSGNVVTFALTN